MDRQDKTQRAQTFKSLFCARFQCPEEAFERRALRQLVHRKAVLPGLILLWINPHFFETDFKILGRISELERLEDLMLAASELRHDYRRDQDFGFLRKVVKIRISGARLVRVGEQIFPPRAEDT